MTSARAQVLIVVALLGVVVLTAVYGQEVSADSGAFAFALFGIPLTCTVVALGVERATDKVWAAAIVAVLGAVCLVWSLLNAGGLGYGLLPSSLLLLVAGTVSWIDRRGRDSAPSRPHSGANDR